jgi:sulfate transport system permease protein
VSGHIRGQTNTMPLHIEIPLQRVPLRRRLAVASLLALLALLTLVLKYALEQRVKSQRREAGERTE